jgi:hypothetical protein
MSPTSLSARVPGEGAAYVLTVSLTKESPYAFDLLLKISDRHYTACPIIPSLRRTRKRLVLCAEHKWLRDAHPLEKADEIIKPFSWSGSQHCGGYLCVSVSVALLLANLGSVTPLGAVTVAVSESVPVADGLIVPVAM